MQAVTDLLHVHCAMESRALCSTLHFVRSVHRNQSASYVSSLVGGLPGPHPLAAARRCVPAIYRYPCVTRASDHQHTASVCLPAKLTAKTAAPSGACRDKRTLSAAGRGDRWRAGRPHFPRPSDAGRRPDASRRLGCLSTCADTIVAAAAAAVAVSTR